MDNQTSKKRKHEMESRQVSACRFVAQCHGIAIAGPCGLHESAAFLGNFCWRAGENLLVREEIAIQKATAKVGNFLSKDTQTAIPILGRYRIPPTMLRSPPSFSPLRELDETASSRDLCLLPVCLLALTPSGVY